jgi:hypothetical protein
MEDTLAGALAVVFQCFLNQPTEFINYHGRGVCNTDLVGSTGLVAGIGQDQTRGRFARSLAEGTAGVQQ